MNKKQILCIYVLLHLMTVNGFADTFTDNFNNNLIDPENWDMYVKGRITIEEKDGDLIFKTPAGEPTANGRAILKRQLEGNFEITGAYKWINSDYQCYRRSGIMITSIDGSDYVHLYILRTDTHNIVQLIKKDGFDGGVAYEPIEGKLRLKRVGNEIEAYYGSNAEQLFKTLNFTPSPVKVYIYAHNSHSLPDVPPSVFPKFEVHWRYFVVTAARINNNYYPFPDINQDCLVNVPDLHIITSQWLQYPNIGRGLMGHWTFDEGEGSTAYDDSGNNNDGVIHNAQWIAGLSGNALSLNGTESYIEIPNASTLHSDRAITVTGWFFAYELPNNFVCNPTYDWAAIFWKGNFPECTTGCENREYSLYLRNDGVLTLASTPVDRIGIGQLGCNTDPGTIAVNQWYHFAAVIDSNSSRMSLFVNGNLKATKSYHSSSIRTTDESLSFGYGHTCSYFNGILDDIRIYDHALVGNEVKYLYDNPGITVENWSYSSDLDSNGLVNLCDYAIFAAKWLRINPDCADRLWNIKWFHCDRGHDNVILNRDGTPICGSAECSGEPDSCWGPTRTELSYSYLDFISWFTGSKGSLYLDHKVDVQVYGDTYLYVTTPKTISFTIETNGGTKCVWLNNNVVSTPGSSSVILYLVSGWNHLEWTTMHQHGNGSFYVDFPFADEVELMSSSPIQ